jgi:hypothetical protein
MNRRVGLSVVLALVALAGCSSRTHWHAQPVAAQGLAIRPFQVYGKGALLFVRTLVTNQGPAPVVVDRDTLSLTLPNGQVVGRSQGTFTQHTPYTILPRATRPVYVDFRAEGFDWHSFPEARVNWQSAVTVNGTPIALPPMTIHQ